MRLHEYDLWVVMLAAWTLVIASGAMGAFCALSFRKICGVVK